MTESVVVHYRDGQLLKGQTTGFSGENLRFDVQHLDDGEHWACRLEEYLTDPADDPTMQNWDTDLTIKLAD